jgi:circadian clock protein KaiC
MTTKLAYDERISSGIPGLDEVLRGGYPKDALYLVQGNPGVGKTTFALQFLLDGVKRGEKSMYVSFSETKDELDAVARAHGWTLDGLSLYELSAADSRTREAE